MTPLERLLLCHDGSSFVLFPYATRSAFFFATQPICATPRSGSTLLCEALRTTGIAGRPGEYFQALKETGLPPEPAHYFTDLNHPEITTILNKLPSVPAIHTHSTRAFPDYTDYLAQAFAWGTTPNGVFGAKITWDEFDEFILHLRQIPAYHEIAIAPLLATIFPDLHYIWITRRDKVEQAVSLWKAIQTWIWEARDPPHVTNPLPERDIVFHFEAIDFLRQQIESYEVAMQHYFETNHIQPFIVIYEEFVAAYEKTALEILRYLHLDVPKDLVFAPRAMKQQADALSEVWVERYLHLKQTKNAE